MAETKPWADGPWQLIDTKGWKSTDRNEHGSIMMALEMLAAHNCFLRGINAIYLQAPNISDPKDIADLLYLCQVWFMTISHHHHAEEQDLFSDMEALAGKPGLMGTNRQQHEAFHHGLEDFNKYATETAPENYRGEDLKKIIDSFMPPLYTHLNEEIPTMLAMGEYDDAEVRKIWKKTEEHAKNSDGANPRFKDIVCCGLSCIDRSHEGGLHKAFPPLPFFIPYLVRYLWGRQHRGSWRLLPCDEWGRRRALPFV